MTTKTIRLNWRKESTQRKKRTSTNPIMDDGKEQRGWALLNKGNLCTREPLDEEAFVWGKYAFI